MVASDMNADMNDDISVKSKTLFDWVFEIISWGFCALIALGFLIHTWPILLIGLILYLASEYPEELQIFAFFAAMIFFILAIVLSIRDGVAGDHKSSIKHKFAQNYSGSKSSNALSNNSGLNTNRVKPDQLLAESVSLSPSSPENSQILLNGSFSEHSRASKTIFPPETRLLPEYRFSKFDYQIAQAQLKSIGLYLGTVDGKWGPRSQKALENLKELLMAQNEEWNYDDKTLIFILVKVGEEQMTDSEAVEAESSSFNIEHAAFPKPNNSSGKANLYDTPSMPAYGFNGIERVSGYFRSNGTYVEPYHRTRANSTEADNWSTKGNLNPFTGKRGSKR